MELPFMHTPIVLRFDAEETFRLEDLIFSEVPNGSPSTKQVVAELVIPPINVLASNIYASVTALLSQPTTPNNSPAATRANNSTTSTPTRQRRRQFAIWDTLQNILEQRHKTEEPEIPRSPFYTKSLENLQKCSVELSEEGVGGTYFLLDHDGNKFAVFKPIDEEPGAPSNPKKLVTNPLLPPGGGGIREAAAYALDRGWAGVPETHFLTNVETQLGTKTGSIQQFLPNDGESSSVGSSSFAVEDVHRIGVLDVRLFNMDRNGENMLLKREGSQYRLIPIDHAYILPEALDGAYFDWMYWSQAKKPFSQETLNYIQSIDEAADAKVLRDLGISELSIRTMLVSTMVLKHCAALGRNLFEIASFVCRDCPSTPSQLELLVELALAETPVSDTMTFCNKFLSLLKETIV